MRAYLLDAAAMGLGKCDDRKVGPVLVDAFNATLLIPEKEESFRPPESDDEASLESFCRLEAKQQLQGSVLRRFATIDERRAESLMDKAEPSVRAQVLNTMISRVLTAKNYDHALELLRQSQPEGFPYGEATELMFQLPPSRDADKQELFRLAMASDHERHTRIIGSDDFGSMIVRFWRHVPPAVALEAIHQVLDAAQSHGTSGIALDAPAGNVAFTSEHEYRVFELLPVLRQLDSSEADKLLSASQQAQSQLKQFPNGIQSLNPDIGDTAQKDRKNAFTGGAGGSPSVVSQHLQRAAVAKGYESRIKGIVQMAEDSPKQAIASAEALPNSDSAILFGSQNPRADALLAVAKATMKKNPSAAKAALEEMAEALKSGVHPYGAMENWTEAMKVARQIDDGDLALSLFRSGMDQADQLAKEDTDSDDPNIALKAWWPSVSAAWQLVRAASAVSPAGTLERVRETKDQETLLLLEIALANKGLGAHEDQLITSVQKRKNQAKSWSQYRALDEK